MLKQSSYPRRTTYLRSVAVPLIASLGLITAIGLMAGAPSAVASSPLSSPIPPDEASYDAPTYSSPIALTNDKAFVWSVNPSDDSVSVIDTHSDTEVARIHVGNEPQSVAVDPEGEYAYVANAAGNSVSVIHVANTYPFEAYVVDTFTTGAEPWNIVISPDGKRVYVTNSVQDTLTVIKADADYPGKPWIIGYVTLNNSACNADNPDRHFQPRGLAVTLDNTKLYVTRFLSFVKPGGVQRTDTGKEGLVCRLDIDTAAKGIRNSVTGFTPITLQAQDTGFTNPDGSPTSAYPNQLQSIVIRGDRAYLPSIATSPDGPQRFNNTTMAFVNAIGGVNGGAQSDLGALNLHLGARVPEAGKTRLFFANPWAIAFTNQEGDGNAYVVSSGSDLLVKVNVDADGNLSFTSGVSTTRFIDLNPNGDENSGKNPLGIVIKDGTKAYVMNKISRNLSVVDLTSDSVSNVIPLTDLPQPGSKEEQLLVGAEIFFSSRGHFERPEGTTVSTDNRLSSEGWQGCASCHFNGWTDGEIWAFASGPRKSVPLNGTFNPHDPDDQRMLNYSAFFDEVEDFEINIRNVSGPGPLATPIAGSVQDPNHGLLISDTGNINFAPTVINAFPLANAGRQELTVRLPGSDTSWPALTAMKEWVRLAIRQPNGALTRSELQARGSVGDRAVERGRELFYQAGCATCHSGGKWTISMKDFVSPPAAAEIATETNPPPTFGMPVGATYLHRFLVNINSFNLNVAGQGNTIPGQPEIGGVEKNEGGLDALGIDYNGDGKGTGFNVPSLLGIWHLPPYYHNGACETLACVLADVNHRRAGLQPGYPDPLDNPRNQARVVAFLKTLDAETDFTFDEPMGPYNPNAPDVPDDPEPAQPEAGN